MTRVRDKLKEVRGILQMTQQEFAEVTGIYALAINQLENGKRRLSAINAIRLEQTLRSIHQEERLAPVDMLASEVLGRIQLSAERWMEMQVAEDLEEAWIEFKKEREGANAAAS